MGSEFVIYICLLMLIIVILIYINQIKEINKTKIKNSKTNVYQYFSKKFMTDCELNFYNKLKILEDRYHIVPQICLATVITKKKSKYHNELNRYVDFAIFNKDYTKLLLLIELNDKSHEQKDRSDRDTKVKKICSDAGIKLMFFHTKYPNEQNYVINRIIKEIESD